MTNDPSLSMTRRNLIAGGMAATMLGGCATRPEVAKLDIKTDDFVNVEGLRLRFAVAGSGRPVVCIHGASGNLGDWTFGPFHQVAATRRAITFDRPGLGLSDPAEPVEDVFRQAAVLRAATRKLGHDKVTLIGHSYGGAVALAWALDAPETVDGMLLLAAVSQIWEGSVGGIYDWLNAPMIGPMVARAVPFLATDARVAASLESIFAPQTPPEGYLDHFHPELTLQNGVIRRNARQMGALKSQIAAMAPRYPTLAMPIEVLHGTADYLVPIAIHSERLVEQVTTARLTRLEGIGHMPHHTATGDMLAALARL